MYAPFCTSATFVVSATIPSSSDVTFFCVVNHTIFLIPVQSSDTFPAITTSDSLPLTQTNESPLTETSGAVLSITKFHSYPVQKNGENYIGHCDRTSAFDDMALVVGDSEISFDADTGSNLLDVSIYYNKLYGAI